VNAIRDLVNGITRGRHDLVSAKSLSKQAVRELDHGGLAFQNTRAVLRDQRLTTL
jgi:hypothetical protein